MSALKYLWALRRQRYNISINTHPQSRAHYRLVARIVGARQRLSHEYDHHTLGDRWFVNRTAPQDYSLHTVENNLRLLRLLVRTTTAGARTGSLSVTKRDRVG